MSANLTLRVVEDLDGDMFGTQAVTGVAAGGGACTHAICSSLVAMWKLEDLSDATGGGHTLTNNNTATFVAGKIGNAANFVAPSTQYLSIASFAGINPNNTAFTVDFWFNPTSIALQTILAKRNDASGGGYEFNLMADNSLQFRLFDSGGAAAAGLSALVSFSTGTWYHITGKYDPSVGGGTAYLYVNASVVDTQVVGSTPASTTADFTIGRRSYTGFEQYADGKVDAVAFFNASLSDPNITYLDNSGAGREYPYT